MGSQPAWRAALIRFWHMAHVFLIVEGQSEELYYKRHFAPVYEAQGLYFQVTMMPGKRGATSRTHKGGSVSYAACVANVRRFLRTAGHCELVALVYDYYGLHPSFAEGISLPVNQPLTAEKRATAIRQRLEAEINDPRFCFFLQLHEFEAYLFSSPEAVARHYADPALLPVLTEILAAFDNRPEAINNHPDTAPSKRLMTALRPRYYAKTTDGVAIVHAIGVPAVRACCPAFDAFCQRFDQLA